MNAIRRLAGLAVLVALWLALGTAGTTAQAAGGQDQGAKQPYTMAEYNSYKACADDKVPASLIKCLDDFVSKYPNSALLQYAYPLYYQAYGAQKNYAKVIENADKLIALGDKIDAATRSQTFLQAYNVREGAWTTLPAADQVAGAAAAREAASAALKILDAIKKPDNVSDDDFKKSKLPYIIFFNNTGAQASVLLKDFAGAMTFYKQILAINPDEPVTQYNMGKAYLAMNPPQTMEGYWHIAKAITSKAATDVQKKAITPYLKKLILAYQGGTVCDSLTDSEFSELLQLAGSSADRPESYKLLSAADLDAARKDMTIASVIADLKAGGDKAKVTWFASCGLEFPDVPGRLFEVIAPAADSDPVILKIAFVTSQAEFDAATAPDMEVKVIGQPEAGKLNKDDNPAPRFTGTLASYDPAPAFLLHWDKAKVNPEDLPKEKDKPATKKPPVRKPAPKKPSQ
jgi:tetratricopeptide (TPR) repeat protein